MQHRFVVGGIGVVPVQVPVVGAEMDFHRPHDELGAVGETHGGARKVGSAAMVPETWLDDFDGAAVVGFKDRGIKLLEPKGLDLHLGRLCRGSLAQAPGGW